MQEAAHNSSQRAIPADTTEEELPATIVGERHNPHWHRLENPNILAGPFTISGDSPVHWSSDPAPTPIPPSPRTSRSESYSLSDHSAPERPVRTSPGSSVGVPDPEIPVPVPCPGLREAGGDSDRTHPSLEKDRSSAITLIDEFEKQFILNEEQQQQEFLQEEEHRNLRFAEAETVKDEAEAERTAAFRQRSDNHDEKFRTAMTMHQHTFEGSEASRGVREALRTQESQAAEEDRTQTFERVLAHIRHQYNTLDAMEVDVLQSMKRRLTKVQKSHQELFEQAKQQRSVVFASSRACRELGLRVPVLEVGEPVFDTPSWPAWRTVHRPEPREGRVNLLIHGGSRSRRSRSRRSRSPVERRPSPSTGFVSLFVPRATSSLIICASSICRVPKCFFVRQICSDPSQYLVLTNMLSLVLEGIPILLVGSSSYLKDHKPTERNYLRMVFRGDGAYSK
jgi:hypothetical protein